MPITIIVPHKKKCVDIKCDFTGCNRALSFKIKRDEEMSDVCDIAIRKMWFIGSGMSICPRCVKNLPLSCVSTGEYSLQKASFEGE